MEQAARWVGNVSWQAGALIALVLAIRFAMGRRLTPGWRCALWVLVGIRLVTSGLVGFPTHNSGGVASATPSSPTAMTSGPTVTITKFWNDLQPPASVNADDHKPALPHATNWRVVLSWAWAGGAAVLLGRLVTSNVRLARRVRRMKPVTDLDVLHSVRACAVEMGVRRTVTVVETAGVRSPAVWGAWRTVVMLPAGCDLEGEDLRMVLLHEMAHVRRRDVWVEWATGVLTAMHWFNPFVWAAAAAYRADRELACDTAVLARVGKEQRREYGACLLRVVEAVAGMRPEPAAVGVFGSRRNLRQRIDLIAEYGPQRPAAWTAAGVAAFVLVGCATMTGAKKDAKEAAAVGEQNTAAKDAPALPVSPSPLDQHLPELRLDQVAFADVIEQLRTRTGLNFFVNWNALEAAGVGRTTPVTTRLRDVRISKALETILRDVGGGRSELRYVMDEGVVTISTKRDLPEETATRVYDVRDLVVDVPDFGGEPPARTVSMQGMITPPSTEEVRKGPADRARQIIQLIEQTVDPGSWRDRGGDVGTIRNTSGQLVVTQTLQNLTTIEGLLHQLQETRTIQVAVEARVLSVDPAALPPKLKGALSGASVHTPGSDSTVSGGYLSSPDVAEAVRAIEQLPGTTTLAAPRLMLFNGQRAQVRIARPVTYTADIQVVKDGKETRYQPVDGFKDVGLVFEVQGTASRDRKAVTMSLRTQVVRKVDLENLEFRHPPGTSPSGVFLQEPVVHMTALETVASAPDGETLVLRKDPPVGSGNPVLLVLARPTLVIRQLASN